jgi:hypothetical protein
MPKIFNPTWADELPVAQLPADPAFRENFCFDGYDHERNIGFWLHLGRWSQDNSLWREQINVYLPDGTQLMRRSFGHRDIHNAAAGACFTITIEDPARAIRLGYNGPARVMTDAELASAPVREAEMPILNFDIQFQSDHGVWDFDSKPGSEVWMASHYEQPGKAIGRISWGGKDYEITGAGYRDHSRGPRSFAGLVGSCWLHGVFPSGRAFALIDILILQDGKLSRAPSSKAVIFENGKVHDAIAEHPPYLESVTSQHDPYTLKLTSELGVMEIEAQPRRGVPHSTTATFESFDGIARGHAPIGTYEQGTTFVWDGQLASGHTERAIRLDGIDPPAKLWASLA